MPAPGTDLVAPRLASQLLAGRPARTPEEVVERLLAVQAQDPRGARLSVRSRSSGLAASDVDHALTVTRSLVVTWLIRGTLHLVAAADYWWLRELIAPGLATMSARRLRQEGVSPEQAERGIEVVADAVESGGPQTREQLRRRLDAAGVPTADQALVHVLLAASLRGLVVRGPMVGREQAFVSVSSWLGPPPAPLAPEEALGRLAHRYLAGHGPAEPPDLAKWAGIPLGAARRGFAAAGEESGASRRRVRLPPPRLLGPFDPLLHGWASRAPFVGHHSGVVTTNGIFRPVALVEGHVVATWRLAGGVLTIDYLERVPAAAHTALVEDGAAVLRFLGLPDRPVVVG